MTLEKLLNTKTGYAFSTNYISIDYTLNNLENGEFVFAEEKEEEIPLAVSVYKVLKGLPIIILSSAEIKEDKIVLNIVKGTSDIKNIKKWIIEDVAVTIHGQDASFKTFSEEEKKYLLTKRATIISTIIDSKKGFDNEIISSEDLLDIVNKYY